MEEKNIELIKKMWQNYKELSGFEHKVREEMIKQFDSFSRWSQADG